MTHKLTAEKAYLALDVGQKRIGVARANAVARLPEPLEYLVNDEQVFDKIYKLTSQENIGVIVVGVPRNLNGDETSQSAEIRHFASTLKSKIDLPIEFADESFSSKRADEYIKANKLTSVSQDSVAACFILNEYLLK